MKAKMKIEIPKFNQKSFLANNQKKKYNLIAVISKMLTFAPFKTLIH